MASVTIRTDGLEELASSLGSYNAEVNQLVSTIAKSFQALALILVGTLFLVEILSWYQYFSREGSGITLKLWLEVTMKYLIALFLVLSFSTIFDALVEVGSLAIKTAMRSGNTVIMEFNELRKGNFALRWLLNFIGMSIGTVGNWILKLLVLLRFLQMYLLKAIAPLFIAFWMASGTRSIAVNMLKQFGVYVAQGVILAVVVILFPMLVGNSMVTVELEGGWAMFKEAIALIFKGGLFIIMMVSSQRLAKAIIGSS